jgi:hypothetical protein
MTIATRYSLMFSLIDGDVQIVPESDAVFYDWPHRPGYRLSAVWCEVAAGTLAAVEACKPLFEGHYSPLGTQRHVLVSGRRID